MAVGKLEERRRDDPCGNEESMAMEEGRGGRKSGAFLAEEYR